ncbi:MAG TPA: ABC transporter permease subunit [Bacillota bacterium]|nr:ABC transporter permease subunit [Bacillota bacterium]
MNIFIREMKTNAKSLLIWCFSMIFLIYAGLLKYSAFAKTGDAIMQFMAQIPDSMKVIMGIMEGADLTSVAVFYSIFFLYFILLATVHSSMLGALIIAKEERDKTADFLYVKPITRKYAITCKIAAAVVNILILNLVTFAASAFFVEQYNTGTPLTYPVFLICVALFLIQLIFLGLGLLLGALAKNAKSATSIVSSIILVTFILKVIIDLNSDLGFLRSFSPFLYFNANTVMFQKQIDPAFGLLSIALTLLCAAGTYFFFNRRDLRC